MASAERARLLDVLAQELGVEPLTGPEVESLLSLAGDAAHGTGDRTSAPLTTFLAGVAAASAPDRRAVIDGLRERVAELAPSS